MLIEIPDPPVILALRSPGWRDLRDEHVAKCPYCAVCGAAEVEVHHVRPFHLFPEAELDPANLLTLCRVHHFWFGHLGSWMAWNPDVVADAMTWRCKIGARLSRYVGETT